MEDMLHNKMIQAEMVCQVSGEEDGEEERWGGVRREKRERTSLQRQ
jgi:hypothetical protein